MVLRPEGLVDFTLKTKDLALSFTKALNDLESIRTATTHADTVVEVRIDFVFPGFPSEPITNYLQQNYGEYLQPLSAFQTGLIYKQVPEYSNYEKYWKKTPYSATFSLESSNFV